MEHIEHLKYTVLTSFNVKKFKWLLMSCVLNIAKGFVNHVIPVLQ